MGALVKDIYGYINTFLNEFWYKSFKSLISLG